MIRVKICGIRKLEDALFACQLGADALGFIFAESPRRVSVDEARAIIAQLPPFVTTVGVFVNSDPEEVSSSARSCKLDFLQFHGDESPQYCLQFPYWRIIKSFRIDNEDSLSQIPRYQVAACLLDSFSNKVYGGSGKTFDWELALRAKECGKPIVLAGGLTPHNVQSAIERVCPDAVDISSGVESEPGKKDKDKLRRFMEICQQYRQ